MTRGTIDIDFGRTQTLIVDVKQNMIPTVTIEFSDGEQDVHVTVDTKHARRLLALLVGLCEVSLDE